MSKETLTIDQCIQWLERDDTKSRPYRATRLQLLLKEYGLEDGFHIFYGRIVSTWAFAEARLAYLNGLFIACIILCQICLEHTLAGLLHMEGKGEAQNMPYSALLREARDHHYISDDEFSLFDQLRMDRNPYAHFRAPTDDHDISNRAISFDVPMDDLVVKDAEHSIVALLNLFQRYPFAAPDEKE